MKPAPHTFVIRAGQFLLDGEPFKFRCGELHYPRVPRPYWRHRIQMAKAMGLNSICLYLFWNYHEAKDGKFDFTGKRDVAAFARICQEEGMWCLLRPGPYSCAEWDFGGLPWWLLKDPTMQVRCSHPGFLAAVTRYLRAVSKELAPLQVSRGGPIVMVQVENEYGAFGNDKNYLLSLEKTLRKSGFDVPLFRCDWANPAQLTPGAFNDEITTVANFGSNPEKNITNLVAAYPKSPKMCSEFWMGWFDWWGMPRNGKDRADGIAHARDIQWMLDNDVSFSLYMFHGGTNFGFSSGANNHGRYDPYVTSYDYWAPLTEQGRPREKFFLFRDLMSKQTGLTFPEPPEPLPLMSIPRFELTHSASLLADLPKAISSLVPRPMETYDQSHGCILYRTDLTGRAAGESDLQIRDVHDIAWVFLNGQLLGCLDRRFKQTKLRLAIPKEGPAILDILVESMGRVNFGPTIMDRKGITDRVEFGFLTLFDWQVFPLPLDSSHLKRVRYKKLKPATQAGAKRSAAPDFSDLAKPSFFKGTFAITAPKKSPIPDTHLDVRGWGKGYVWINGKLLGRYWQIGPQQTLYVPGCWLKPGKNDVVILDLLNAGSRSLEGVETTILDELNLPPGTEIPPRSPSKGRQFSVSMKTTMELTKVELK